MKFTLPQIIQQANSRLNELDMPHVRDARTVKVLVSLGRNINGAVKTTSFTIAACPDIQAELTQQGTLFSKCSAVTPAFAKCSAVTPAFANDVLSFFMGWNHINKSWEPLEIIQVERLFRQALAPSPLVMV